MLYPAELRARVSQTAIAGVARTHLPDGPEGVRRSALTNRSWPDWQGPERRYLEHSEVHFDAIPGLAKPEGGILSSKLMDSAFGALRRPGMTE